MTCEAVVGVLRSGGWCGPEHAEVLARGVSRGTNKPFLLLTDMDVPGVDCTPLEHGWPGWWSKMEVMRPDIGGGLLYLDMDTIVFGDLTPLIEFDRLGMIGDFYTPTRVESGVMVLPEWARKRAWERFIADPEAGMAWKYDGQFLAYTFPEAVMLQRHISGLHSYKVDGKQDDTRLLIYHGKPRPHETEYWHVASSQRSVELPAMPLC